MPDRRLLLLSNSRNDGQGYLEHAEAEIKAFLGERLRQVLFIPFAAVRYTFAQFADNHFMTGYGGLTQQLLDLLKATHMEEHVKWFFLLGGLDHPTAMSEPRELQLATFG